MRIWGSCLRPDPTISKEVEKAFSRFTPKAGTTLKAVREMILASADELEVGPLTETLKWSEPAYLTEASRAGTTIRLGQPKGKPDHCAIFVHCQTTLVAEFRETITNPAIGFEGNRAVTFEAGGTLPREALQHVIAQALTYKRR